MKAFDRACIIILAWIGILNFCAFFMTRGAAIVAIASTIVCFAFVVYENRIMYYEEKAEHYRKMFMEQNKAYLQTVLDYKPEKKDETRHINISFMQKQRQKSVIDKSKVS